MALKASNTHLRTTLIVDALQMARDHGHLDAAGAIFHSDYAEDDVKPRNRVDAGCLRGTAFVFSA